MILGEQLISELKRRGGLGMYFDYRAYQQLHRVETLEDLTDFLSGQDLGEVVASRDVARVVDEIQTAMVRKSARMLRRFALKRTAFAVVAFAVLSPMDLGAGLIVGLGLLLSGLQYYVLGHGRMLRRLAAMWETPPRNA